MMARKRKTAWAKMQRRAIQAWMIDAKTITEKSAGNAATRSWEPCARHMGLGLRLALVPIRSSEQCWTARDQRLFPTTSRSPLETGRGVGTWPLTSPLDAKQLNRGACPMWTGSSIFLGDGYSSQCLLLLRPAANCCSTLPAIVVALHVRLGVRERLSERHHAVRS